MRSLTRGQMGLDDCSDLEFSDLFGFEAQKALQYYSVIDILEEERQKVRSTIEALRKSKSPASQKACIYLSAYSKTLFARINAIRNATQHEPEPKQEVTAPQFYTMEDLTRRYHLSASQVFAQWLRRNLSRININEKLVYKDGKAWVILPQAIPIIDQLRKH